MASAVLCCPQASHQVMLATERASFMSTELATETRRTGFVLPADADIMRVSQEELDSNEEFYEIPGFSLVSDKMSVVGLPFSILGVTYQQPVADKANDWGQRDYVSLQCVVTNQNGIDDALRRGLIPSGEAAYDAGERILINDGSTGIRRQITKLLHGFGLINVGTVESDHDFDKPWVQWDMDEFEQFEQQGDVIVPSFTRNHNGNRLHFKVRRGLRVSDYTNDYGEGVTFYL